MHWMYLSYWCNHVTKSLCRLVVHFYKMPSCLPFIEMIGMASLHLINA
jgi:hypothetical protein